MAESVDDSHKRSAILCDGVSGDNRGRVVMMWCWLVGGVMGGIGSCLGVFLW